MSVKKTTNCSRCSAWRSLSTSMCPSSPDGNGGSRRPQRLEPSRRLLRHGIQRRPVLTSRLDQRRGQTERHPQRLLQRDGSTRGQSLRTGHDAALLQHRRRVRMHQHRQVRADLQRVRRIELGLESLCLQYHGILRSGSQLNDRCGSYLYLCHAVYHR